MKRVIVVCALALFSIAAHGQITVINPISDVMIDDAVTPINGVAPAESVTKVVLRSAATPEPVEVSVEPGFRTWSVPAFPLNPGLNVITVETRPATVPTLLYLTRANGITRHTTPQKVALVWENGVDDQLKKIAKETIARELTAGELTTFVNLVRQTVPEVFRRAYRGLGVVVTDAEDDTTHSVVFHDFELSGLFGQSFGDCGNDVAKQTSDVFVGTYVRLMTTQFDRWAPMAKTDTLEMRAQDVAEALGRTAAHETGHSLGLVGTNGEERCGFMRGCDGGHTCVALQQAGMARFGGGFFIMDPGPKSANQARIGEGSKAARGQNRQPSVFCNFDKSYLDFIQPAP
jgi:hypothetical protein